MRQARIRAARSSLLLAVPLLLLTLADPNHPMSKLVAQILCVAKYNSSGGGSLKEAIAVFSPAV